jgi:hypothetical protein
MEVLYSGRRTCWFDGFSAFISGWPGFAGGDNTITSMGMLEGLGKTSNSVSSNNCQVSKVKMILIEFVIFFSIGRLSTSAFFDLWLSENGLLFNKKGRLSTVFPQVRR